MTQPYKRGSSERFSLKLPSTFHSDESFDPEVEEAPNYFLGIAFSGVELARFIQYLESQQNPEIPLIPIENVKPDVTKAQLEALVSKLVRFGVKGVMRQSDIAQLLDLSKVELGYIFARQEIFARTKCFANKHDAFMDLYECSENGEPRNPDLVLEGDFIYYRKTIGGRQFDIRIMQLGNYLDVNKSSPSRT